MSYESLEKQLQRKLDDYLKNNPNIDEENIPIEIQETFWKLNHRNVYKVNNFKYIDNNYDPKIAENIEDPDCQDIQEEDREIINNNIEAINKKKNEKIEHPSLVDQLILNVRNLDKKKISRIAEQKMKTVQQDPIPYVANSEKSKDKISSSPSQQSKRKYTKIQDKSLQKQLQHKHKQDRIYAKKYYEKNKEIIKQKRIERYNKQNGY